MRTFFDTSAFAKRYIEEPGSEQIEALCAQSTALAVSIICLPELISALCRLQQESVLKEEPYTQAKQAILDDLSDATVCNITISVIEQTIQVLETSPVRTMDALHIGCALEWNADLFVSADRRQCTAAEEAGIRVATI
ncbi:MAG: type II toxin-antitoxin system VapC family toxin [bacterium]|nr:type II toxin-antitoxin system VapC family toxin [bacterium]